MTLWIRSQDREKLVKCNDIVVNGSSIIGYFDKDTEYEDLGTYETKERALEVLDEIQNIIKPKFLIRLDEAKQEIADFLNVGDAYIIAENNGDVKNINNTFVYEMPKE